jgi:hypothetical protein
VRPARNWKGGNFLADYPATTTVKHRPVDVEAHRQWSQSIQHIPPEQR